MMSMLIECAFNFKLLDLFKTIVKVILTELGLNPENNEGKININLLPILFLLYNQNMNQQGLYLK